MTRYNVQKEKQHPSCFPGPRAARRRLEDALPGLQSKPCLCGPSEALGTSAHAWASPHSALLAQPLSRHASTRLLSLSSQTSSYPDVYCPLCPLQTQKSLPHYLPCLCPTRPGFTSEPMTSRPKQRTAPLSSSSSRARLALAI